MAGDPGIPDQIAGYPAIPDAAIYSKEGKSQVVIGIGCTGGKHRSVAIAEYLGKMIGSGETEIVRK